MTEQKIEQIARVCHEANKAWCDANGDYSQPEWLNAPDWQKESAILGVKFKLANPDAGNDAMHNSWLVEKEKDGWVYGEEKDAEAKTHPCMVAYEELPEFQKKKDALFAAIVTALK